MRKTRGQFFFVDDQEVSSTVEASNKIDTNKDTSKTEQPSRIDEYNLHMDVTKQMKERSKHPMLRQWQV